MNLLEELVGKKVSVYSIQATGERQDVGVLEAFDTHYLKIRKGESEVLFFSVYQIRLVKLFYQ